MIPYGLKRLLYFSFIHSRITYGIELYGSCRKGLLDKLQTLQNKLLKVLYKKPFRTNTNDLHSELNLLKVNDIFNLYLLKFVFKVKNKEIIKQFFDYFKAIESIHHHETRYRHMLNENRNKLIETKSNTKFGTTMTSRLGATLWNIHVNNNTYNSMYVFKRAVKQKFLSTYQN